MLQQHHLLLDQIHLRLDDLWGREVHWYLLDLRRHVMVLLRICPIVGEGGRPLPTLRNLSRSLYRLRHADSLIEIWTFFT